MTTNMPYLTAFNALERHIEDRYQIPVRIGDVPHPFTGDLTGAEIVVDYDVDAETALFILIHLFGHTVQWNLSDRARELSILQETHSGPMSPALREELERFEREACEYSLRLLHEAGVHNLDQWVSDYAACDFRYLMHYYDTGEKRPFTSFYVPNQPLIRPRPIPAFSPTRWVGRWDGIVV
ncbi:MAG: hypothetical protein ACI855_004960 [Myxococcota bacterium]|jgi:hypothetical protein